MDKFQQLFNSFELVKKVKEHSVQDHKDKKFNELFERMTKLSEGQVTILIEIKDVPRKDLMLLMDALQKQSNELLHDEVPNVLMSSNGIGGKHGSTEKRSGSRKKIV